jgi:hypothetical protein
MRGGEEKACSGSALGSPAGAAECALDLVEGDGEGGQVAAIDTALVELTSELAQQGRPAVTTRRLMPHNRYLDDALDDFDRCATRCGRA